MKLSVLILTVLGLLWILAITVGMFALMQYEYTPGTAVKPDRQWPVCSQIRLCTNRPILLMFVHPQCPCSRASISELNKLMAACKVKPKAYLVLFSPKVVTPDWDKNAILLSIQNIPGIEVLQDIDGIEAKKFHAVTSGQTMIYSPHGQLLFSGGITLARGLEGDNCGSNSAKLALCMPSERTRTGDVFGCSLVSNAKKSN